MQRPWTPALALAAICVLASVCASTASAGILLPQQVTFDEKDLAQDLAAGLAPRSSSAGTSAPARRHSPVWPEENSNEPNSPLELASSLPTGTSSSTTSSPSPGGAVGSGVVLCVLNNTLTLQDDSPLGTLAEDHGFSLPDPPGTDLLRPPRSRA
jgi:hypothetical protein